MDGKSRKWWRLKFGKRGASEEERRRKREGICG
jgi:hypothetical protein